MLNNNSLWAEGWCYHSVQAGFRITTDLGNVCYALFSWWPKRASGCRLLLQSLVANLLAETESSFKWRVSPVDISHSILRMTGNTNKFLVKKEKRLIILGSLLHASRESQVSVVVCINKSHWFTHFETFVAQCLPNPLSNVGLNTSPPDDDYREGLPAVIHLGSKKVSQWVSLMPVSGLTEPRGPWHSGRHGI